MTRPQGFTLMEMMIVVAIIAALVGVGYPVTRSFVGKSREAACLDQLRSLGAGLEMYLQDHAHVLPDLASGRASKSDEAPVLEVVLLPYLESPTAFQCPADKKLFGETGSSYLWNSTQSGLPLSKLSFFGIKNRPDKIPLISDKESWHPNGTNFLYGDLSGSNKTRFAAGN